MSNQSAFSRLSKLEGIFSLQDLAKMYPDLNQDSMNVMLGRWKKNKMIAPVGPRAGMYFNLVKNPNAENELKMEAIQRLYPSAVLIGAFSLLEAEWVTQDQKTPDIAVITKSGRPIAVYGANLYHRPALWYKQVGLSKNISSLGLPMIEPEYAIADAVRYGDTWLPDPDDLYLPNDIQCLKAIDAACQNLKVQSPYQSSLHNKPGDLSLSEDNGFNFG